MRPSNKTPTPPILKLAQIATWHRPVPGTSPPAIIARVPSLQRGAVWKPGQVELLWDSILRGFPIGSFVVCKKLPGQNSRNFEVGRREIKEEGSTTHHLLDGQQRAIAISLGFDDPFADKEPRSAVLWLDLLPTLSVNSSRSFLFRVTTEAHPWGYAKGDDASVIPASRRREALKDYGWRNEEGEVLTLGRPTPRDTWPIEANAPIPVAWLFQGSNQVRLSDSERFWANVRNHLQTLHDTVLKSAWAKAVNNFLDDKKEPASRQRKAIFEGFRRAQTLQIVLLEVPDDAIAWVTAQESKIEGSATSDKVSRDNIANVEHLFQRLNAGGTALGGEELAYSMIKAYWPEVEEPIERLAKRRMPSSRLVRLGARVSLVQSATSSDKLPGPLSVSELRGIALSQDKTHVDRRGRILGFFLPNGDPTSPLEAVLHIIDDWLSEPENSTGGIGLPPVLQSSIARTSPDVYMLLMWIAQRALTEGLREQDYSMLRKPILGLATALHWFGYDKGRAAAELYKTLKERPLEPASFEGLLKGVYSLENGKVGLFHLATPKRLKCSIELPDNENSLKEWRWWKLPHSEENKELNSALQRLKNERELLLYAQRNYLRSHFGGYDPARQDLWDQHNRPWDYDHILPSAKVYGQHNIPEGVKEWAYSIANLRAWPMEDNRSDQADSPAKKLHQSCARKDSFITKDQVFGFERGYEDVRDLKKVLLFISKAKDRLIRIYWEWYHTLDIDDLIGTH